MARHCQRRDGAAAVEFALLSPFLIFVFLVGADWSRIFFTAHVVQDCARAGALAASGIAYQEHGLTVAERDARGVSAALDDADNLTPTLRAGDIVVKTGSEEVAVTVTYSFQTVTKFPGVAGPWEIKRTVRMPLLP